MTYANGNPGPGLGQAQQCGRVKLVNRIPTLPVLIIRSPTAIQKQTQSHHKKHAQIRFHSKRPHTITIYMYGYFICLKKLML